MGLFDFFKNKKEEKQNYTYARMINGEIPIYSQFGDDIYASDVVNQALYSIVTEVMKLNPKHIRKDGFDIIPVHKDVQNVLDNPNPLMTTCEYLEKITWNLLLHYNSFIYKQYDLNGKLIGLYPLQPTQVTFLESAGGELFVKLYFKNGSHNILPYSRLIHIKSHFSLSDLMGGDESGQPNNSPLLSTLKLNDTLLSGVKKALHSSFAVNGVVKYHTMIDNGTMAENIAEFEKKLTSNSSGILGIDNKAEFIPINRNIQLVDEATLAFIDDKILRNFGVPIEIVRGNYTTEQYEAFYQKTIEPIVIAMSQAHTKSIFSEREKGFTNEIKFYTKELIFMNTTQKLEMINLLGQTGTLYENEKRVAFGYEPLPELAGVRLQSLNWVDVKYAEKYQTGQQNTNTGTGNKAQGGEENE